MGCKFGRLLTHLTLTIPEHEDIIQENQHQHPGDLSFHHQT